MPQPLIGRLNTLQATATHDSGMLLDGGELGDILLPRRYVPADFAPGGEIEVFLSLDSEDRLVATTERPLAMAGEFAMLKVIAGTRVGSFLDWGMPKDLLLPFSEQPQRLRVGEMALVYIYVDKVSRRLVASAKLKKFVAASAPAGLESGSRVEMIIAERTDLGFKVIVDEGYWGLLHLGEGETSPARGTRCTGYISRVLEDGLVDLSLHPPGYAKIPAAAEQLATTLAGAEGRFLPLHDKSPPERVRELLGVSKKVFKQALGGLYKAGRVRIAEDGIYLLD